MITETVSVIVPVFNGAAYLANALWSIFGQTREPNEVIVVDDGSTDGSAEIARFAYGAGSGSRSRPIRALQPHATADSNWRRAR